MRRELACVVPRDVAATEACAPAVAVAGELHDDGERNIPECRVMEVWPLGLGDDLRLVGVARTETGGLVNAVNVPEFPLDLRRDLPAFAGGELDVGEQAGRRAGVDAERVARACRRITELGQGCARALEQLQLNRILLVVGRIFQGELRLLGCAARENWRCRTWTACLPDDAELPAVGVERTAAHGAMVDGVGGAIVAVQGVAEIHW